MLPAGQSESWVESGKELQREGQQEINNAKQKQLVESAVDGAGAKLKSLVTVSITMSTPLDVILYLFPELRMVTLTSVPWDTRRVIRKSKMRETWRTKRHSGSTSTLQMRPFLMGSPSQAKRVSRGNCRVYREWSRATRRSKTKAT